MQIVSSYKAKILNINLSLIPTMNIYRQAVSFLIDAINKEWSGLSVLAIKEKVNTVEKLTHLTKDNPHPKYDFDTPFYKFPSYLRRSAISDAIGVVSSYYSNLENYNKERYEKISNGKKFRKKAPKLSLKHYKCPALYKGNMFTPIDRNTCLIKVYRSKDWVWLKVNLREQDIKYIENNSKGKGFSPILVNKGNNYYLQFAFENKAILKKIKLKQQIIVAVDLGLNNTAVCSAMCADGTVIGRIFINKPIEKDHMNHLINRLCKKQNQSGYGAKLPKAWNAINNLNNEIVNKAVNEIVNFAIKYNADVIVFEYLGNFKSIKGKNAKKIRMRLQLWAKRTIQKKVEHKAHSYGIRVNRVSAKNTSILAFDGSGKVKRDSKDYSLCTFSSNKKYNCDLNATYNIGSRYYIREIEKSTSAKKWSEVVAKVPQLMRRTQCTLSTLISLRKAV